MERKEAVHLVSRALSIFFGVCSAEATTYLPERLFSYVHYTNQWRSVQGAGASVFLPSLYRAEIGVLFLRIVVYLALAVIFWKCSPWIQYTLLPESER